VARLTRRLNIPVLGIALIALVTACGGEGAATTTTTPPATTGPGETTTTAQATTSAAAAEVVEVSVILDWLMEASYAQLLYGVENGIFAQHGLDVEIISGMGSDLAMGQINEGEVDFAFTDLETYLVQRANGDTDTTAVYAWLNQPTIGIASLTPIENPEDMVGLSWGTVGFSSGPVLLPFVLEQNGVDPSTVTIELLDFSVLYPTFLQGQLDSVEAHLPGSAEGLILNADKQGIDVYFKPLSDWGLRGYSKMLIVPNETLATNPDLVERFVAAIHESMLEATANATTEAVRPVGCL
jgi:NitT/TauT family transport system substrate-binding protein